MSEKQTSPREVEPTAKSTTREVEPTAAKSTTREAEPNTVKATTPPPKPDEASVDVGKIPGPRWSNFVQQHLDNEYIAYVPLIVAFSLIAAFVVAGRPFLTRPYAATTKVGAAESC